MNKRFQVAIVGGGPVGLGLALDLGLRGISCILLERRTRPHRIPRGQNLTQRTLEHFYFWGIVDQLRAARIMPPGYPIGNVNAYRSLTSEYWHAHEGRETVRRYFFQDNERLPQYQTEDVLRTKLSTLPSVEQRFGWTAGKLEQDANSVRLEITDENGASETIEADYLVGCDGSHSAIRAQVGIERGGTDFDQVMMLAVFRSPELHEKLKRFPERSTYRVMDPALNGYWQFFGRIDVGNGFSSIRPCRRKPPSRRISTSRPFWKRLPASSSRPSSIISDSGICALPSPTNIRSAAFSSLAMRRTATRPMAASASTTVLRTRAISAGSCGAR